MQTFSEWSSPLSYLRFHYHSHFKFLHSINILTYSRTLFVSQVYWNVSSERVGSVVWFVRDYIPTARDLVWHMTSIQYIFVK